MTPRRLFGTDGVRGVYGRDLTDALVERLGRAFGIWNRGRPVLVGRDTRASGLALEQAIARGLASAGVEVRLGGVLPTPAVALLAGGFGAVVSASHNSAEYNGVKFFGAGGSKLTDADEAAIEALLDEPAPDGGAVLEEDGLAEEYVGLVSERFGAPLDGLRMALDCANGAMGVAAPSVFERLGASVVTIGNEPDGANINAGCGATDLRLLERTVAGGEFDLGVAFDGDGDRMLAVDEGGDALDGDEILAVLTLYLGVDLVAVTEMTNLGFHRLMRERGVRVVTTDVGDRYVLEALARERGVLGGEQSGHVVYLDGHKTGDGLVAALLLARAVTENARPLSQLAAVLQLRPQARRDVRVANKDIPESLRAELERIDREAGDDTRVLVRPSGTEPVVRVLAEAGNETKAEELAATIASLVERALG